MSEDFDAMARAAFVGETEPMLAQLEVDLLGIPVLRPQVSEPQPWVLLGWQSWPAVSTATSTS